MTGRTAVEECQALVAEADADVARLTKELAEAGDAIASIDALEVVSHDLLVARENARRSLPRLRRSLAFAEERRAELGEKLAAAERAAADAKRDALAARAKADEAEIADLIRRAILGQGLAQRIRAHQGIVAEATEAARAAARLAGYADPDPVSTRWHGVDPASPWRAIESFALAEHYDSPAEVGKRDRARREEDAWKRQIEDEAARLAARRRRFEVRREALNREHRARVGDYLAARTDQAESELGEEESALRLAELALAQRRADGPPRTAR